MPPKDKYSDPKLRDQIKEEVMQSDKGGAPGQWSARKAQFMASEYKKRGGGYNQDESKKDESQKNLSKWGEEEWQTKEGSGNAKKEDGTQKRYLPKKAWEEMSEKEKQETDKKKQKESKEGKQFVGNTEKAKNSRKKISEQEEKKDDSEKKESGRGQKRKSTSDEKTEKQESTSNEKKKAAKGTHGSKHDSYEAPGNQASKDRLPEVGKTVSWKAMPGWVEGEVKEILRKAKTVNGKNVKASQDDPRIVLKSHGPSGKLAVHNPEAVYF